MPAKHRLLRLGRRPPQALARAGTQRSLLTLAIETSCDDTAVAVISRSDSGRVALLFNDSVASDNRRFMGVNPAVTVDGHQTALAALVRRAIAVLPSAGKGPAAVGNEDGEKKATPTTNPKASPDLVAATRGPGLLSNLSVGLSLVKGLAVAWDVPLLGVHHMQAHALTPRLVQALDAAVGPEFPFLSLLVSGGHTQLVRSLSLTDHRIVADTTDIAVGNLLDQTARVILPPELLDANPDVSYGRLLEHFAFPLPASSISGDGLIEQYTAFFRPAISRGHELAHVPSGYAWSLGTPLRNTRRLAFSFSSIHSQVHAIVKSRAGSMDFAERRALARHTLRAAFQHLASRLCVALAEQPETLQAAANTVVVAGGVASNRFLFHVLRTTLAARGFSDVRFLTPPPALCTDNAAMVAWAAMEMYDAGWHTDPSALPISPWPMDPGIEGVGKGLLGVDGWLRRDDATW